jgi:hypothetical protein
MIRHCDKANDENPCCSSLGYERANAWHIVFDTLITESLLHIYAPSADYSTLCKPNLELMKDSSCQKSQRMGITAMLIQYNINIPATMHFNYCSGDHHDLVQDINHNKKKIENALVVWQHSEMVDMVNDWGVSLSSWPENLDDIYNLIFKLDFTSDPPSLSYNCYDFQHDVMQCDDRVTAWLSGYPVFPVNLLG